MAHAYPNATVQLQDYVASHGIGNATDEGMALGLQLIAQGDDVATAAHEVVARGMVAEAEPQWFRNHYRHVGCIDPDTGDDTEWSDEWSCMCNDHCPTCDAEIEPYESQEVEDGDGDD